VAAWLWIAAAGTVSAEPAKGQRPPLRIGVLRVEFRGSIPTEIRRMFQQRVIDGLTASDIQAFPVVGDDGGSCGDAGCLTETARRLRVDFLVTGSIEEHAKTYGVVLRLIEGRKGQEIGAHRDTCETCGAEEAAEKMELAAATLRGRLASLAEQPSRFIVRSNPTGAALLLDGRPAGRTPLDLALKAGEHVLRLTSEGYQPIEK